MADTVIQVEHLSKRYRIGVKEEQRSNTLIGGIVDVMRRPIKNWQYLRSLSRFQTDNHNDADSILWALKEVSFEVKPGEVLGIIGKNGAGKSTLLKILSRITAPTSGRIKLKGRVASLLEVGTGFHPDLTGRENIYLNGTILGMRRAEVNRKFDEIVAFSGVEKFVDTPVKRYSSGMRVRLGFAVASHLEPEILVIDEVLSVGDVSFQKKCLGKMDEVAGEGKTVLFVSHNMLAIRSLCHRALLFEEGRIQQEGEVSSVVQHYLGYKESEVSQRIWPQEQRPGNDSMKINSVKLKNQFGKEVSFFNMSEDAIIEISYEIIQENAKVRFSLTLFDGDGNCVFSSMNNHEKNFYGKPLRCGQYTSTCCIYGHLLNAKSFYVHLRGFAANRTDVFDIEYVFSFNVIDDGILKGDYHGASGGPIKPKLEWKTNKIH
jgi:lipopolysaccharide transport system ATP-binding protein